MNSQRIYAIKCTKTQGFNMFNSVIINSMMFLWGYDHAVSFG